MANKHYSAEVARGASAAKALRGALSLGHPTEVPIEDVAFARGALVRDVPLTGVQGRLTRIGSKAIIAVSSGITYRPRRRFVIAHELGHLELHEQQNQIELCEEGDVNEVYEVGTEQEANSFATELLMPEDLWARKVDVRKPSLDVTAKLAADFEVSFTAATLRFARLTPERCCAVFSQDGTIRWSVAGPEFGHWLSWGSKLDAYTLAYDYFEKGRVSDTAETVSASAWLASDRLGRDDDLIEHSRPIPSLKAVLSLLWIPSDREF